MINMSSKDATSLLGTYLLQGWIMTDLICSKDNCGVPLMRSKDGSIQFCVVHDTLPTHMNSKHSSSSSSSSINTSTSVTKIEDKTSQRLAANVESNATTKENSIYEFRLKEKRREQSSLASQLIGQRMLQRWVLLNETCPNEDCYAIPLIRHPSNKTMLCVICEQTYQHERDTIVVSQPLAVDNNEEKEKIPTETSSNNNDDKNSVTQIPTKTSDLHTPLSSPTLDRSSKRQKKTETELLNNNSSESSQLNTTSTASLSKSSFPATKQSIENCIEDGRDANEYAIRCLSKKMRKMMDEIEVCTDHYQLIKIVQAVEACSKGINTLKETLENM